MCWNLLNLMKLLNPGIIMNFGIAVKIVMISDRNENCDVPYRSLFHKACQWLFHKDHIEPPKHWVGEILNSNCLAAQVGWECVRWFYKFHGWYCNWLMPDHVRKGKRFRTFKSWNWSVMPSACSHASVISIARMEVEGGESPENTDCSISVC